MAVARDGVVTGRAGDTLNDSRSHAERLPLEAESFLRAHGLAFRDIDVFVVLAGPGSFTGLRVGVAAVQGWAMALGRTVTGVPTLEALVSSVGSDERRGGVLVPCLDGLRGEVFYGAWRWDTELLLPQVGASADVIAAVQEVAGADRVYVAGDGAAKYADAWRNAGWHSVKPAMSLAEAAAHLALAGRGVNGAPHAVRLTYVRKTDAEINRERGGRRA